MKTVTIMYRDKMKADDKYEKVTGIAYGENIITIRQLGKIIKIAYDSVLKTVEEDKK